MRSATLTATRPNITAWGCCLLLLSAVLSAHGQGIDPANRPVAEVRIEGLKQVPEQLVRNAIRVSPGDPFDENVVQADQVRINHLGRFKTVTPKVKQNADGSLILIYVVEEQPLIQDVQFVGNKALTDIELISLVVLRPGDPVDRFSIDQASTRIKQAYELKGYFVTDVLVDTKQLEETGVLIFRIREGPRVRLRTIQFEGNTAFSDKELKSKIESNTYVFIFRDGAVSQEKLDRDAERIRDFYRQRGYLDAQCGRRVQMSNDQRDANVVFDIDEGSIYRVKSVTVEGNSVFTSTQIMETMTLKVGDVYSSDRRSKSQQAVSDMYGKLGFIQVGVNIPTPLFDEQNPVVDVVVNIREGKPYTVGSIEIRGNQLTKSNVVIRQIRGMEPGRRFDGTGLRKTRQRLNESPLFEDATVTILGSEEDDTRDVLLRVKEKNTGSLSFGAGISSDAGIIGAIDLVQRNFDITNTPASFKEFITGKAFRGAGQYFALSLQPGDEFSRYSVSFREPYILDSNYFMDTSLFFFKRDRVDYDEQRTGGSVGFGQRFGDVWRASVGVRAEEIELTGLDPGAATDVFEEAGQNTLTALSFSVTRSTVDSRLFPTRGSRTRASVSQAGAIGGDYTFTKAALGWDKFWTVDEDFFERKTVFSISSDVGYIFGGAPVFERFYAGGHRSLRGFDFRGVGPRDTTGPPPGLVGSKSDESVGGDWLFLLSFEYNFPVYQEVLRVVVFMDTGTVEEDIEFSNYRMAVGAGLRLKVPFLGQAPFALDFAIPVMKDGDDETKVFSFDIALPF